MKNETVKLNKKDLLDAYDAADENAKELLEWLFPGELEKSLDDILLEYANHVGISIFWFQDPFLNFILSLKALAWHLNPPDWVPDYKDWGEKKYGIRIIMDVTYELYPDITYTFESFYDLFGVHFKTKELARKALDILINEGVIQKTFGV
jgi:hypothetical protein